MRSKQMNALLFRTVPPRADSESDLDGNACVRCGDDAGEREVCAECHRVLGYLVLHKGLDWSDLSRQGEFEPPVPVEVYNAFTNGVARISEEERREDRKVAAVFGESEAVCSEPEVAIV